MRATVKNNKGKLEKNAQVKEGDCIFPFKYKKVKYDDCMDSPKGKKCATEINEHGTMTKYGYCEEIGVAKPPSARASPKKASPKKASPKASPKKASPKKASPKKASPKKASPKKASPKKGTVKKARKVAKLKLVQKATIKKHKALKKKSTSLKKLKSKISDKRITTTRSPSASRRSKSPGSQERSSRKLKEDFSLTRKAIKQPKSKMAARTKARKLKIVESLTSLKTSPSSKPMDTKKRLNEEFIGVLSELMDIMMRQGEPFRAKAYREASEAIMTYDGDITDPNQLKGVKHIGKTILAKLNEYVETGTLRVLERERTNPLNQLTKVYGIGPKKAKELMAEGITSLADLRKREDLLTENMKLGLQYFDDIEARIPRSEIEDYRKTLTTIFNESTPPGSDFKIVGSFRRGANTSGDIDMIVTNDDNNKAAFNDFLDRLIKDKIILAVLTRGKTKSMTIGQLPGMRPRRLDFLYASPSEYAFAVLYFTGSKTFNTVQRQRALNLGYSLNEHGLYSMVSGKKGAKIDGDFPTEKSIFDFLGMEYREPKDRIDGRSMKLIPKGKSPVQPEVAPAVEKPKSPSPKVVKKSEEKKKIVKKISTLKKHRTSPEPDHFTELKTEGISALKRLTEEQLSKMIRDANDAYYCSKKPLLTDNEYDILREYTARKHPKNEAVVEGHTKCDLKVEKNKVKLPYEMWSMDKIKPDTGALKAWMDKYKGPYVLSCKLDGVSGMYSTEDGKKKLYTRGNGTVGQDVSHLIPYLQLPSEPDIVIRGEFIVPKEVFAKKYAKEFANPRNFVAGVVNQKKIEPSKFKDIDFVAYEVIVPVMKPSAQMAFLTGSNVEVVFNLTEKTITNELLSELLVAWRSDYKYEIDGVICINDQIYDRESGNPEHAFAFKMVLSDQIAESKVLDVIWTASKDGYLKPRVQIDPVVLGGAKIEYATGFNAKFIQDNMIGVGAVIKLIRSGDVIPHIVAVIAPAEHAQLPNVPFLWNDTHVDIILANKAGDAVVLEKTLTGFFRGIGVDGLSSGNVRRIIAAGYDTVPKIIDMTKTDFLKVEGFKDKLATKISEGIKNRVAEATLPELMHATNIFGRGFGTRRFLAILKEYPDILVSDESESEKMTKLESVSGMAKKSAQRFMEYLPMFLEWAKQSHIEDRLVFAAPKPQGNPEHPLFGKKWVMTGFRDKALIEKLKAVGAEQSNSVSSKVFVVLVKDEEEDTGKAEEARKLGIPVMTPAQFEAKYDL